MPVKIIKKVNPYINNGQDMSSIWAFMNGFNKTVFCSVYNSIEYDVVFVRFWAIEELILNGIV